MKRLLASILASPLFMACGPESATTPNGQTVIVIMKDTDSSYPLRHEGKLLEWEGDFMAVRTADTTTTIIPTNNVGVVYVYDQ